jgi:hypothetical protein
MIIVIKKYRSRLFQFIIGITCFLFCNVSFAQSGDTLNVKRDTIASDKFQSSALKLPQVKHSPRKAALMSTALPGLGQVYNKKYWKVPVIYIGLGALVYSFQSNQSKYVRYRDAYKYRIDSDPATVDNYIGIYSDDNLANLYKYYHRYRDLSVIGIAAVYLLNIVDASVDAHLYNFDVSDNLTFNVRPTMIQTEPFHYKTGISLSVRF